MRPPPLGVVFLLAALGAAIATPLARAAEPVPDEYAPEEFPAWMLKLRRAEIIAFGSLPFTMFAVRLGYETARYLGHVGDDDAARWAPWPFRSANPVAYTPAENLGVGVGVVVCSVAVAVADLLIGELRERRRASR